jgi:hypothetical protein
VRVERADHHARDPKAVADPGRQPRGPNLGDVVEGFFKSADADKDGKVSQPELEQALEKMLNPPVSYTRAGDVQTAPAGHRFDAIA